MRADAMHGHIFSACAVLCIDSAEFVDRYSERVRRSDYATSWCRRRVNSGGESSLAMSRGGLHSSPEGFSRVDSEAHKLAG